MMYWSLISPMWDITSYPDVRSSAGCPFCGRTPVFRSVGFIRLRFRMECDCGTCGPKVEWLYGTNPKQLAAESWDVAMGGIDVFR